MAPLSPAPDAPDGLPGARRVVAIAAVLAAMVLVVLDAAIANVALPTIGRALQVEPAIAVGVITAYQLGLVTALLPVAALGECVGYRRVFVAGVGLFTGASVLCAASPSLHWLVAARFVQGLGGAAVMALGVALLRFATPKDRLAAAIGWNALAVALASATGPSLGAAILSATSWPWLFLVNLPVGAVVLAAACALPSVEGTGRRPDPASVALNGGTFALLVLSSEWAATRPIVAGALFAGGAACAAALVRREKGRPTPLVPLDLLGRVPFRVSVVASVLLFTGQTAGLLALSFHLQHVLGLRLLVAGLYLTAWPLTVAAAAPVAGRLADRLPTAWLCLAGGIILALGLAATAICGRPARPLVLGACIMACGLGFGLFNVPNNRNMFLSAPRERSGAAGGLQSVARLTGQTTGAVAMTVLLTFAPLKIAAGIGLLLGAALTCAAGLASMLRVGAPQPAA